MGAKVMKFIPDTQNMDSVLQSYKARGIDARVMDTRETINRNDSVSNAKDRAIERMSELFKSDSSKNILSINSMLLNKLDSIALNGGMRLPFNPPTEETPKINPKANQNELLDTLVKVVQKGSLDVNIKDRGNNVDSVKSNSQFIQTRVTETNVFGEN
jgi:hypothetical protein